MDNVRTADTAGLATFPPPGQERAPQTTPAVAYVLSVLLVLIGYGRHLAETIERRATSRGFATIARYFGTATVSVILAHLYRGIMRAIVLERMLRKRAARGHDLRVPAPRAAHQPKPQMPPGETATCPLAAEAPRAPDAQTAATRPARRPGPAEPPTLANLPSVAQLEAQVRRRGIGNSLLDICRDLGASFTLCERSFGNRLFNVIHCFRGNIAGFMMEMRRREKAFDKQVQDKSPGLDWPEETNTGIRRVMGFLIGEPPSGPFGVAPSPAAAVAVAATGPP